MKKLLSVLMTLLLLVGCSGGGGNNGGGGSESEGTTVTIQSPTPMISMDTAIATDGTSFSAQTMVMAGLMSFDSSGAPELDLAEDYTVSDDGLVFTFKIRDDANWSNGDPVTANDFVYAWNRVVDPDVASDYSFLLDTAMVNGENGVQAVALDDKTLQVTLYGPSGLFINLLGFPTFFPVNQAFAEEKGDQYALSVDNMLFCGPYTLTSWEPGYAFEFELNPNYWDAANYAGKYADRVIFREISDSQTALMEYESGNLDTVSLSGEQVNANKDNPGYEARLTGYSWYLSLNMGHNLQNRPGAADLANLNVRKAIALALDRETIAGVLNDGSIASGGIIPVGLAGNPDTNKDYRDDAGTITEYNLEKAKEFYQAAVAELGHDITLDLLYGTDEGDSPIKAAEQIQYFLEQAGFTINLNGKPKKERLNMAGNEGGHDYDMMLTRWGPDYGDPQTYMDLFLEAYLEDTNDGGYISEEYERLVADAETGAGSTDPAVRWQDWLDAEVQLVVTDAAIVPVFQAGGAMLINPNVSGIEFHAATVDSYRHLVVKE